MQAQNPFTVCSNRVYQCLYLCWYVCVCACKLKGNFSRKNTFTLLRFYGCLDLFLVRRWLLFHCPGEYHTTKECCCCCCCCGFSVFHVMQLIKKLFAPCCPYKKQKREAQKERQQEQLGHVWHYALPFPPSSCVSPSVRSPHSGSGSRCDRAPHTSSPRHPLAPSPTPCHDTLGLL